MAGRTSNGANPRKKTRFVEIGYIYLDFNVLSQNFASKSFPPTSPLANINIQEHSIFNLFPAPMENDESVYFLVGLILNNMSNLILLTTSIILVRKRKNAITILILIANILAFVFFWISVFGVRIAAQKNGTEGLLKFNQFVNTVGPLPHILFSIGLLLFVVKHLKKMN